MAARHVAVVALVAGAALYVSTRAPLCLFTQDRHYEFHGRVADQNGAPVADAQILARTYKLGIPPFNLLLALAWRTWPNDTDRTTTRNDGGFALGGCGQSLRVKVLRSGYVIRPIWVFDMQRNEPPATPEAQTARRRSDVFFLEPEGGDEQSGLRELQVSRSEPFTIPAWKRGEPAARLLGPESGFPNGPFKLESDGTIYTVDLRADAEERLRAGAVPGDFRLAVRRDWQGDWHDAPEHYRWSLELTAIDGGLIETRDPFLFQAPETGYQPSVEIDATGGRYQSSRMTRRFYLRSRGGGQYASLVLTVDPAMAAGESVLGMAWRANPDGSGNLLPTRDTDAFNLAIYPW